MSTIKKGTVCPLCENGKLSLMKKDLIFSYKGRSKKFPNEKVYICNLCNFETLTDEDNHNIEKALTDFRRSVDGLLSCSQLKSIREKLCLKKKQMAKLLSINEKTIGRYENGKVTQSVQIDKLYRILEAYPSAARIMDPDIKVICFDFTIDTKRVGRDTYNPKFKSTYNLIGAPDNYPISIGDAVNAA